MYLRVAGSELRPLLHRIGLAQALTLDQNLPDDYNFIEDIIICPSTQPALQVEFLAIFAGYALCDDKTHLAQVSASQ